MLRLIVAVALILGSLGLLFFLRAAVRGMVVPNAAVMPLIIVAGLCTTLVHECAHGTAVKYFGRTVGAVGAGWFWFGPVFFVDTSDMWLGTRLQRIAVSLAGPMVEFTLAGTVALAAGTIAPG